MVDLSTTPTNQEKTQFPMARSSTWAYPQLVTDFVKDQAHNYCLFCFWFSNVFLDFSWIPTFFLDLVNYTPKPGENNSLWPGAAHGLIPNWWLILWRIKHRTIVCFVSGFQMFFGLLLDTNVFSGSCQLHHQTRRKQFPMARSSTWAYPQLVTDFVKDQAHNFCLFCFWFSNVFWTFIGCQHFSGSWTANLRGTSIQGGPTSSWAIPSKFIILCWFSNIVIYVHFMSTCNVLWIYTLQFLSPFKKCH